METDSSTETVVGWSPYKETDKKKSERGRERQSPNRKGRVRKVCASRERSRVPAGAVEPPYPRTHLHEVVDRLQIGQIVVVDVHADAEVEAGIASVNDLKVPELWGKEAVRHGVCPGPHVRGRGGQII